MRTFLRWCICGAGLAALALLTVGCGKKPAAKTETPPVEVKVITPIYKDVVAEEEFTGWTRAKDMAELKASRVTGYLINRAAYKRLMAQHKLNLERIQRGEAVPPSMPEKDDKSFKEPNIKDGADVKEGDELFFIDPRAYMAEVERSFANVRQAQATWNRLKEDLTRAQEAGGGSTREERERLRSNLLEASASIQAARASQTTAQINLDFTTIRAKFSGRLSRRLIDPGNIVKPEETVLSTLVSLDPIHAYFNVDERTVLRLRRLIQEKKIPSARTTKREVKIALADEEDFKHVGIIDFIDNQLDQGTGTLNVRAVLPNPTLPGASTPLFSPGMFVRVRVPIGNPEPALLVPEKALGSDQGERYLYIVENGLARQVNVKIGPEEKHRLPDETKNYRDESFRVVIQVKRPNQPTLTAESLVIMDGIQNVADKTKVVTEQIAVREKKPANAK
jgi:RND family efflux transporter MFP subunit